jgi:hypothetical protein
VHAHFLSKKRCDLVSNSDLPAILTPCKTTVLPAAVLICAAFLATVLSSPGRGWWFCERILTGPLPGGFGVEDREGIVAVEGGLQECHRDSSCQWSETFSKGRTLPGNKEVHLECCPHTPTPGVGWPGPLPTPLPCRLVGQHPVAQQGFALSPSMLESNFCWIHMKTDLLCSQNALTFLYHFCGSILCYRWSLWQVETVLTGQSTNKRRNRRLAL